MAQKAYFHEPVLLKEVVLFLKPEKGQTFVDATLGGGGYSQAILKKIGPGRDHVAAVRPYAIPAGACFVHQKGCNVHHR